MNDQNKINKITKNISSLIEKDNNILKQLKILMVNNNQFEIASDLRDIERENNPKSKEDLEDLEEYDKSEVLQTLLAICDIKCSIKVSYMIKELVTIYNEKGGEVSLQHAADIKAKSEQIFN